MAGITLPTEKVIYRNTKPISKILPKFELVASHTARRSFATNAYKAGVPAISIMKITGHHKSETLMKYIKITEEENAVLMVSHKFFK
jgi:integrase